MASTSDEKPSAVDHHDDVQDVDIAVQLAHVAVEHTTSPWTPRLFRLYLCLAVAYLCGYVLYPLLNTVQGR